MKRLIYISCFFLIGCSTKYYIVEDTNMVKEGKIIEVKKHRAKRIQKKLTKKGFNKPEYIYDQLKLSPDQIDNTIRFRLKEIKQLQK